MKLFSKLCDPVCWLLLAAELSSRNLAFVLMRCIDCHEVPFQPTSAYQTQPASFHRGEIFRLEVRYEGLVFFASVNGDPLFAFNSGSGQLNMQFTEAEVTGALETSFFGFLPPG